MYLGSDIATFRSVWFQSRVMPQKRFPLPTVTLYLRRMFLIRCARLKGDWNLMPKMSTTRTKVIGIVLCLNMPGVRPMSGNHLLLSVSVVDCKLACLLAKDNTCLFLNFC